MEHTARLEHNFPVALGIMFALLLGIFLSACDFVKATDATPEPTIDLQSTVEALVNLELAKVQQEATLDAQVQLIRTPSPTQALASTPTPSLKSNPIPLRLHVDSTDPWEIAFPASWVINRSPGPKGEDDVKWVSFLNPSPDWANLQVIRYVGYGAEYDLPSWSEFLLQRVSASTISHYEVISSEKVTVGGHAAYEVVTTGEMATLIRLHLVIGLDAYLILGATSPDRWDETKELLRALVYSFLLEQDEKSLEFEREELDVTRQSNFIQSLADCTTFLLLLGDYKTANLLRIAMAQARGQSTVPGLILPDNLGALFGLEPGEEFPTGIQEGAVVPTPPMGVAPECTADADGVLGYINKILVGATDGPQGPGLRGQITPGTAQRLSLEDLGAFEAALISWGTTLEEEQRKSRLSALPSGLPFRVTTGKR